MIRLRRGKRRPFAELATALGAAHAIRYWLRWKWNRLRPGPEPYRLSSRAAAYPLWCRPGTSDRDVFNQVFVAREYACLDGVAEPRLIVDCGANVGYTTAYLLTRYPGATAIAIEPDPGNVALLRRNLSRFGGRARIVPSAVWPRRVGLVPSEIPFGDGREWARRVREAHPGETPAMTGVDLGSVLAESGFDRISILKVDVEGAESLLFGGPVPWLDQVDHIAIELHDEESARIFSAAIGSRPFDVSRSGELTVCQRRG